MKINVETLIEKNLAIWNEGKMTYFDDLYRSDFMFLAPDFKEMMDVKAFKEWLKAQRNAYDDFHAEIKDLMVAEDKVVVRWLFRGTHTGMLNDIPPTGKFVELPGITIYELKDGKFFKTWWFFDRMDFLVQLGLMKMPLQQIEGEPV